MSYNKSSNTSEENTKSNFGIDYSSDNFIYSNNSNLYSDIISDDTLSCDKSPKKEDSPIKNTELWNENPSSVNFWRKSIENEKKNFQNVDLKKKGLKFLTEDEYSRKIIKSNLSQLFDDGNEFHEQARSPDTDDFFIWKKNDKWNQIFNKYLNMIRDSHFLSKWYLPCLVFTPIFFIIILLHSLQSSLYTLLLTISMIPIVVVPLVHLFHWDSRTLHSLSLNYGMLMVVVSIILEICFNHIVLSMLSFIKIKSFQELMFVNSYNREIFNALEGTSQMIYTISSCLFIGFIEETFKFICPLTVFFLFIRNCNFAFTTKAGKKDLLMSLRIISICAISSAIGFSIFENIKYASMQYWDLSSDLTTPVLAIMQGIERVLITTPGHVVFSLVSVIGLAEWCLWRMEVRDVIQLDFRLISLIKFFRWHFVACSFHSIYDLLKIASLSLKRYSEFLVIADQFIIPLSLFIFIYFYSNLSMEWSEVIQSQVVEIDGKDEEKSVSLLKSEHIPEELEEFDDVNL